jgi:hemolysin D
MNAMFSSRRIETDRHAQQTINDFESDTAEITGAPPPTSARMTVVVLAFMVVSAIVLASVVRLDRIVMAKGRVVARAPTIVVQPLDTSIVRSLEVRTGQIVKRGEILATLDPTFSAAEVSRLEEEVSSLAAQAARLEADASGRPYVPDGKGIYGDLQFSIWQARQAEYKSKQLYYQQRLESFKALLSRTRDDLSHYKSRLNLSKEIEGMRRTLEDNKTGSRLNSLQAADIRMEMSRQVDATENAKNTASHDMQALEAEREAFTQQWQSETIKDLVARRVDLNRAEEELSKARKRRSLVELRAVDDAVVLEVAAVSVGSVVQSGDKIYSLVPLNSPLEVEGDINGADQGFVKVGDEVKIKFDAYRFTEHGSAKGKVRTISEDSFTRKDDSAVSQQRFYKARIEMTEVALRDVSSDFRLIPGMPLQADIVVGSRTIINYLFGRVMKNFSEGMQEP